MRLQARLRALERRERIFFAHRTSAKHGGGGNCFSPVEPIPTAA
jgi:hypothetical protein